jgi:hypothetical protein
VGKAVNQIGSNLDGETSFAIATRTREGEQANSTLFVVFLPTVVGARRSEQLLYLCRFACATYKAGEGYGQVGDFPCGR